MTKPFRVEEDILKLTKAFRERKAGPKCLYQLLEDEGIKIERSALITHIPDQGACIVGRIVDQDFNLISFDIDFEGNWDVDYSKWRKIKRINEWNSQEIKGDWWWKESPGLTRPKPNNPIYIAIKIIKNEAQHIA